MVAIFYENDDATPLISLKRACNHNEFRGNMLYVFLKMEFYFDDYLLRVCDFN